MGAGSAISEGLVTPGTIVVTSLRSWLRVLTGRASTEMSGPVGIVQETSKTTRIGMAVSLRLTAALASYLLLFVVPGTVLYELLTRRPRTKRASPPPT